jgi:cell wall-associated NlpC family hydrolase
MLTDYSAANSSQVQWWNLAAGTSGAATLPGGTTWQGSAPSGWLLVAADRTTADVESTTGVITSYGQPIGDEAHPGGAIDAISGPDGLVAWGADDGELTYESWAEPGLAVPLNAGTPVTAAGLQCGSMSVSTVGCADLGIDGTSTEMVALPLDGSALRTYPGCPSGDVTVGQRLVYACGTPAHPRFAAASGVVTRSSVTVIAATGVGAFGEFVTEGPVQQQIIAVRTAHSVAKVLVTIARRRPSTLAELDAGNLRTAANAVETEALNSGALSAEPTSQLPAQILLASDIALITAARADDPSFAPKDTRAVMGPVPHPLSHPTKHPPRHFHITRTRSLGRFTHALSDHGAGGFGMHRRHGGASPAHLQHKDGVYVDPKLPTLTSPTIGMVALRTAMAKLGQPYVWAAAGADTFDCSGLVQWAYAHAGVWLTHFSGDQWNEGRKIHARQILPGDLILFDHHAGGHEVIHHVALYVGAGWMLNAPYTGQYVDVVPVPTGVAGVVRP